MLKLLVLGPHFENPSGLSEGEAEGIEEDEETRKRRWAGATPRRTFHRGSWEFVTVTCVKVGPQRSKKRLWESEAPLTALGLSPLCPDSVRLQPAPPRGPKSPPV